jgi:hypothetical protein
MAASENVRQVSESPNPRSEPITPRHGVVTLFGYGIQVRVDKGHLILSDGSGASVVMAGSRALDMACDASWWSAPKAWFR